MNQEITVDILKVKLKTKSITLIDVREEWEFDYCNIKTSKNIPMNSVPLKLSEFNQNMEYAIICHSGVRSAQVVKYLKNNGISAYNVIGGIDQWSVKIDNKIKRY
ncbi:MAG: hypothetical protein CMG60_04385 [Candidatus Marinimicrobia bacterium]|nr:hypothetical protein [Candidatus Neomarinimicrobiota bacterium]|tara:strand:+ start:425 stop:739 length:315 start_codon:yes stop_codon:yes gene_type:complete